MTTAEVAAMWDAQAKAGTVTRDPILKQLEIREIARHVRDGMSVLDAGCGDGHMLLYLGEMYPDITLAGFDYSPGMVERTQHAMAGARWQDRSTILQGDVLDPPFKVEYPMTVGMRFDLVYTERVLINLPDWQTQQRAIEALWNLVAPYGTLLCVESCQDGLDRLNDLRRRVGLEQITPPWHNRYVRAHEMRSALLQAPGECDFTSTYYFLSRVVNAAQAQANGQEPEYDAYVNQLALSLPPIAEGYGQTWSWAWRKA